MQFHQDPRDPRDPRGRLDELNPDPKNLRIRFTMVCSGNPTTNLSRIYDIYALRRVPPGQIPEPLLPGLADLALATVLVTDVTDDMVRREESCGKYAVDVAQDTTRH